MGAGGQARAGWEERGLTSGQTQRTAGLDDGRASVRVYLLGEAVIVPVRHPQIQVAWVA